VIFPELVVCGYPPRDLLLKRRFVPDVVDSMAQIAAAIGDVPAVVGTVELNPTGTGRAFYNAAAFCHRGQILATARKCLLPTYDVFDEDRYFEPATAPTVVAFAGKKIGITICEDIWTHPMISTRRLYHGLDPVAQLAAQKCDLIVNLSASPWHHGQRRRPGNTRHRFRPRPRLSGRLRQCRRRQRRTHLRRPQPRRCRHRRNHRRPPAFAEALQVAGVPTGQRPPAPLPPHQLSTLNSQPHVDDEIADVYAALVLGLRDYTHKSGFKKALIALSGGIDSALVAPSSPPKPSAPPTSSASPSLPRSPRNTPATHARILAANLGIRFETIAIADAVAAAETALGPIFAASNPRRHRGKHSGPRPRCFDDGLSPTNSAPSSLLLATRAKWPSAIARSTATCAVACAVISDVFKMQVYALSRWINRDREIIPVNAIDKATLRRTPTWPSRSGQPPALRPTRRHPQGLRRRRPLASRSRRQGFPRGRR